MGTKDKKKAEIPASIYIAVDRDGIGGARKFDAPIKVVDSNLNARLTFPAQNKHGLVLQPKLAWDRSKAFRATDEGRVYLVYENPSKIGSADIDVYIQSSDHNGTKWTEPKKVHAVNANSQFMPSVAVDQKTGYVAVVWYDARNNDQNAKVHVYANVSRDGGANFLGDTKITPELSDASKTASHQRGKYTGGDPVNAFTDQNQNWVPRQWEAVEWQIQELVITDGKGKGQSRRILTNTAKELKVQGAWDTIPDTTSTYEIKQLYDFDFGDYLGLAYHNGVFYPAWSDNSNWNNSNSDGNRGLLDLYTAKVEVAKAPKANNEQHGALPNQVLHVASPGVLSNDEGPMDGSMTAVRQAGPGNGTLTLNPDGSFDYTPNAGFTGTDWFTYYATDGVVQSNVATVFIDVTLTPVAHDDTYQIGHDQPLIVIGPGVLINDSDPYGNPLTAVRVQSPTKGQLTLNPDGSFVYTPNLHAMGADEFTYYVTAGTLVSNTATVRIDLTNHLPMAGNDQAMTDVGVPVMIDVLLNDEDMEDDPLIITLTSLPANGAVAVDDNDTPGFRGDDFIWYVPSPGFRGTDSFRHRLNDGIGDSAEATVTVIVNPYPVILDTDLSVAATVISEGGSVTLSGVFADLDSDQTHTVEISWGDGEFDTLNLAAGVTSFGPISHVYADDNLGETLSGVHLIAVTVTDQLGARDLALAAVAVLNVVPVVSVGANATVNEGSTFSRTGSFTDPGADEWTATVDYGDGSGVQPLTLNADKTFALSHVYADNGSYTVTVQVTDDEGGVGIATFVVTVKNVNPTGEFCNSGAVQNGSPARVYFCARVDPSPVDTAIGFLYSYDWNNDGDFTDPGESIDVTDPFAEFTFLNAGTYTVRGRIKDKDGGWTDYWTQVEVL